ncbi:hypothetical protein C1H46_044761 [Malus baccata]|uniref:Piezo-type mechanosensitive ion channel homolog domain-containing protein n=1 Tax=Malus baccata TaxID=106549 RepID=A0A540K649_MALBA|nr:hypothetical protein C1H46_044761 [Malus baccata]
MATSLCWSLSGVRHTNVLLTGAVFRTFSINFFTYGFPVSLFALSFWSFHFASICAFGLLAYVGYIIYVFPSLFRLHRLNGLLLVFILLWAASTYIFNVAFAFLNRKIGKNMDIWEMIGLWHYPIPGFFLLAQFCLGILVALGNLVNNSVFLWLSDEDGQSSNDNSTAEGEGETKVFIVATIAWGLRKSSRAIMLALILLIAMKPGFIHAVYGLLQHESSWDFLQIALLACFCAIHNHGSEMLFSFSAIVQHTPGRPFGFSILKAGLNKSVLLSVYASSAIQYRHDNPSYGFLVTSEYLFQMWGRQAAMFPGQKQSYISLFLGFRVFKPGFWGLESGLRGKVLVIAACTLQYNVFRWLKKMPSTILNNGKWEEPCPLFVSTEDANINGSIPREDNKPSTDSEAISVKQEGEVLRVAVINIHLGTFGAAPKRVISGTRSGFLP